MIISAWWLRTSSKFSGQEFEEIHRNIGSSETPKQVRITQSRSSPGNEKCADGGGGGGTTRPLPRDGGAEELRGDPTVGPHPKVWTIDRE